MKIYDGNGVTMVPKNRICQGADGKAFLRGIPQRTSTNLSKIVSGIFSEKKINTHQKDLN